MPVSAKESKSSKVQSDLSKLNAAQQKAITHFSGPALVLAGPGSGKTLVITHRIKILIETYHVNPEQILVITFTRAAALEMKARFAKITDGSYAVKFGTFHSVFYHILQQSGCHTSYQIIREYEKTAYIKEILSQPFYEGEYCAQTGAALLSEISAVKNSGIDIRSYEPHATDRASFYRIYTEYGKRMRTEHKIDFDDMVTLCYEMMQEKPDILAMWQRLFTYILIDEFQDSSPMQYGAVKLLARPENNLFTVGDDDQSVYGFRGAGPGIMQEFMRDYKSAERIILSDNYRCTKEIVEAAGKLICHNKDRFTKKIRAAKDSSAQNAVVIRAFGSREAEYDELVRQLSGRQSDRQLSDTAVIYRTNKEAAYLAECLSRHNIPFVMKERTESIYKTKTAQDLFAYMEFAENPTRALFYRIMNKPLRYISRAAVSEERVDFKKLLFYYKDKPYIAERLRVLMQDIGRLQRLPPYAALIYIRKAIGYDAYIKEQLLHGREDKERVWEELELLSDCAGQYDTLAQWQEHIRMYEEQLEMHASRTDGGRKESGTFRHGQTERSGVALLTMHGAKGLEYGTVYIPDINEGSIPHKKALGTEAVEEERRMLYVAMTRAKERLHLYYVEETDGKKKSRFLKEIME